MIAPAETTTGSFTNASRSWSAYQQAVFEFVVNGSGNAIVAAVAGGGKTSTIVEAARRWMAASNSASALFVAFNKAIAEELAKRLPSGMRAMTFNALGNEILLTSQGCTLGLSNLQTDKTKRQLSDIFKQAPNLANAYDQLPRLISLAKNAGLDPSAADAEWLALADHYGLNISNELDSGSVPCPGCRAGIMVKRYTPRYGGSWFYGCSKYPNCTETLSPSKFEERYRQMRRTLPKPLDMARTLLKNAIAAAYSDTGLPLIDFDDQLYVPVIKNLRHPLGFDIIFVDEAQDTNDVQRALIRLALKDGGRVIAVGDEHQAIYGFRGASHDAIERFRRDFNCTELPLSISYRCPRRVVELAKQWVPAIEPAPNAPDGSIQHLSLSDALPLLTEDADARTGAILCRNNAPLVELSYLLSSHGIATSIYDPHAETARRLKALVTRRRATSVPDLLSKLEAYTAKKAKALRDEDKEEVAAALEDDAESIHLFAEGATSVKEVLAHIDAKFTASGGERKRLALSTIHRAKGLEWPRVYLWRWDLLPSQWATKAWQQQQEENLQYVAVTRAKQELIFLQ